MKLLIDNNKPSPQVHLIITGLGLVFYLLASTYLLLDNHRVSGELKQCNMTLDQHMGGE